MKKVLIVILAALLPVLLGAAKCEEGDQHPSAPRVPEVPRTQTVPTPGQPDPHAGDPQPSGHKERVISVHVGAVEAAFLPATVLIYAAGADPRSIEDHLTTSGVATFTLVYDANGSGDINVTVELKPARAGSKSGFCSIEAGQAGRDPARFVAGGWRANCFLRIKRK